MNAKKVLRKIHLWLSVPTGIFIALICFSGAMMVFEKEITELCRHDLYFVQEVKDSALSEQQVTEIVSATLPDSVEVTGVKTFPQADRAWQVSLSKPRRASVFVDQYTGEIKGRYERLPFFDTMFHLHRWLLDPSKSVGKWIVGVCTLLFVIILITGLLLWLTNRNRPLAQSLKISFNKGWFRFWHDLHVAGGIYATIFLLAMALTGLTWSFSWYRTGFYAMFGVDASAGGHGRPSTEQVVASRNNSPESVDSTRRHHHHGEADGNRREGVDSARQHHHHGEADGNRSEGVDSTRHHHHGEADGNRREGVDSARQHHHHGEADGNRSEGVEKNGSHSSVDASHKDEGNERAANVRSAIFKIHTGGWGGIIAKIITFIAALLGASLPITGYYLWIRRLRNKSKAHRKQNP